MLTQSDIEREKYEARRKFQLDQDSAIIGATREAKLEGKREGQREGKEIGKQSVYSPMRASPSTA